MRTANPRGGPRGFVILKTNGIVESMKIGVSAGEKYVFTNHARGKMRYYRLSESLVKRVIRCPSRTEEGILEGAIASMRPAGTARYSEIWVMCVPVKPKHKGGDRGRRRISPSGRGLKIKIITAWRYPGKAPEREPVPPEILREIKKVF